MMHRKMKQINKKKGFTLIELLLSIALISALAYVSLPVYQSFQIKNDLNIATTTIVQSLRRAQMLSQNMEGDSSWGVAIASGSVTMFKGASYATRDVNYDEKSSISTAITSSGLTEIVFTKLLGDPSAAGTINLSNSITSLEARAITINSQGMVNF